MKVIILAALLLLVGCGPSTYEDCVLNNLKGVCDRYVADRILSACRKKFPLPNEKLYMPEALAPAPVPAN